MKAEAMESMFRAIRKHNALQRQLYITLVLQLLHHEADSYGPLTDELAPCVVESMTTDASI